MIYLWCNKLNHKTTGELMPKRKITHKEVLEYLKKLPYNEFKAVVYDYSTHTMTDFEKELESMVILNFQQRLENLKINQTCPKCNSSNGKKNGVRNNIQVYKCNDCKTQYTLFTDTIL